MCTSIMLLDVSKLYPQTFSKIIVLVKIYPAFPIRYSRSENSLPDNSIYFSFL